MGCHHSKPDNEEFQHDSKGSNAESITETKSQAEAANSLTTKPLSRDSSEQQRHVSHAADSMINEGPLNISSQQEVISSLKNTPKSTPPVSTKSSGEVAKSVEGESSKGDASNDENPSDGNISAAKSQDKMGSDTTRKTSLIDGEVFAKENPDGLYLIVEDSNNGSFIAKYSKTFLDNAVSFARPGQYVTIPGYKYKKPETLASKTQIGIEGYYQAWMAWFKIARSIEAQVVLLPKLADFEISNPTEYQPMQIFAVVKAKVINFGKGLNIKPMNAKEAECIACVPHNFTDLNKYIEKGAAITGNEFIKIVKNTRHHAYLELTN